MKRIFYSLIITLIFLTSCSNDMHYDNPNLFDKKVDFTVNLSLPQYNDLKFPGNSVYVPGYGNGGVFISNLGYYVAFDAHDPNVPPGSDCAILEKHGTEGISSCTKKNTYDLRTGLLIESKSEGENLEFKNMKPYQVIEMGGGILRVKN